MSVLTEGKKDTLLAAIVFAVAIIATTVTVWVAISKTEKIDSLIEGQPYTPITVVEKSAKTIYSDNLITVSSNNPIKCAKESNGDYRLSTNDASITVTPVPVSQNQDPLSLVGNIDGNTATYRTYNGVLYTGFPTKVANEYVYYVLRGQWLFRVTCTNVPEAEYEAMLGSISYNNSGYFKSLDVDLGDDVAFKTFYPVNGLKTEYFSNATPKNGVLDTGMFTVKMPDGWDLYRTEECLVIFNKNTAGEQVAIFTLRSVTFTEKRFARFLDKVYGGHTEFGRETLGKLEYVTTDVQNKNQIDQVLAVPINRIFGLMIQSHSKTGKLTETQKEIISSISFK